MLCDILKMPFLTHTDFLASTLWPHNPSLHPPILYVRGRLIAAARVIATAAQRPAHRVPSAACHPPPATRRQGLFADWDGAKAYDPELLPTLIYADMRTGSAKALVQMDQARRNSYHDRSARADGPGAS